MTTTKNSIVEFLGDIAELDINKYDYDKDDETGEWISYDEGSYNVIFYKGSHFAFNTIKEKYPIDKWIKDGIAKIVKQNEEKKKSMVIDKKTALALNKELNKIRKEPETAPDKTKTLKVNLPEVKGQANNVPHDPLKKEKERMKNATLENVYNVTEKYLHINDRKRIDAILAVVLSNELPGTPLWLYIVGASGDWKSAFLRSLEGVKNITKLDQITKNTLASGLPNIKDLGYELQNNSTILLFPDLAAITSMSTDDKNAIWGQLRNVYDGFINKKAGSGVHRIYENCHVSLLAGTTQAIRNEILIHAQLGTRELMYDTEADPIDNDFKMDMALKNEEYEEKMQREIHDAVLSFLTYHKIKKIAVPDEMITFIKKEANRLSMLRATGTVDRRYQELLNPISPEVPTRAAKQFKRFYISLKSLDTNYTDERAKEIISHIVDSSGNKVRQKILINLKQYIATGWLRICDVQQNTKIGRRAVKAQLEMLWNMGVVEKEVKQDRVGGSERTVDGYTTTYGGRVEDVAYYRLSDKNIQHTFTV